MKKHVKMVLEVDIYLFRKQDALGNLGVKKDIKQHYDGFIMVLAYILLPRCGGCTYKQPKIASKCYRMLCRRVKAHFRRIFRARISVLYCVVLGVYNALSGSRICEKSHRRGRKLVRLENHIFGWK